MGFKMLFTQSLDNSFTIKNFVYSFSNFFSFQLPKVLGFKNKFIKAFISHTYRAMLFYSKSQSNI
jgi:hypothetical protein